MYNFIRQQIREIPARTIVVAQIAMNLFLPDFTGNWWLFKSGLQ